MSDEERSGDEAAGDDGAEDELSLLQARHRKEARELQGRITALKKSVPKGDKKKKKEVDGEIEKLEADLKRRHETELAAAKQAAAAAATKKPAEAAVNAAAAGADAAGAGEGGDDEEADGQHGKGDRKSKAQRRREKKEEEDKARELRVQLAEPKLGESAREKEDEALAAMLAPLGLQTKLVKADGHCMFRAVALQVSGDDSDTAVQEIRSKTAGHMLAHKDDVLPFMLTDAGDLMSEEEYAEYCRQLKSTSAWGGQVELRSISQVFRRPVEVFQAGAPKMVLGEDFVGSAPVRLSFHKNQFGLGKHYNAVVEKQAEEADEEVDNAPA